MNWTTAWLTMKQGHKVKRHGWKTAYWYIEGTELIIHTESGEELNFRKVKDIGMMLNVTCCEDWEQVVEAPKDRPTLKEAARSWETLIEYPLNVNDTDEIRAWCAEVRKYVPLFAANVKAPEHGSKEET